MSRLVSLSYHYILWTFTEYLSLDWQKGFRTLSLVLPTSPVETSTLADQHKTPSE
jgi:hypothetical protein